MKNLKAYILYVMNFYANYYKVCPLMPEENSGIRPDFLLHKLSHPLFISITN